MNSVSQLFGAYAKHNVRIFPASSTFVCTKTGKYLITAIGPGGGAAASGGIVGPRSATGGAAGGIARSLVTLEAGTELTITIGAGGLGGSQKEGGTYTAPQDGGTTTVSGTGLTTMTANGGKHGNVGTTSADGANGGTASGGNLENVTGGKSGTATSSSTGFAATGGGSVGFYGTGYDSGTATSSGAVHAASGGAGIGGKSGDATASSTNTLTRGGGTHAASASLTNASTPAEQFLGYLTGVSVNTTTSGSVPLTLDAILFPMGACANGPAQPPGVGGMAPTSSPSSVITKGGLYAGGGAACTNSGGVTASYIEGGIGAGGGAAINGDASAANAGKGGDGLVIIEWEGI